MTRSAVCRRAWRPPLNEDPTQTMSRATQPWSLMHETDDPLGKLGPAPHLATAKYASHSHYGT